MLVERTPIPDVLILTPRRFGDDRGWFTETWNAETMAKAGLDLDWRQDNHSFSARAGTLRGLHCQLPPRAQDKLVRCSAGRVLDVAVDVRAGSPTFLAHVAIELSAGNRRQLFIPRGFLHGFLTLTDGAEVQYKCTDTYAPDCDRSIRWDDPAFGIDWGLPSLGMTAPILSPKDAAALDLVTAALPFRWEGAQ